jgi:hypothetical protein
MSVRPTAGFPLEFRVRSRLTFKGAHLELGVAVQYVVSTHYVVVHRVVDEQFGSWTDVANIRFLHDECLMAISFTRRETQTFARIPTFVGRRSAMQTQVLGREALVAVWHNLLATRTDRADAGYELGPVGEVIVSREQDPWHQILVTDVFCQLAEQLGCRAGMRTPIITSTFGIVVPDVVWMPDEKWPDVDDDTPLAIAPDLCVEVLSGNAARACSINNRVAAYLCSGAKEVIVIGHDGSIEFQGRDGIRSSSIYKVRLVLDTPHFTNH